MRHGGDDCETVGRSGETIGRSERLLCGRRSVGKSATLSEKRRRHRQGNSDVVVRETATSSSGKRRRHHRDVRDCYNLPTEQCFCYNVVE